MNIIQSFPETIPSSSCTTIHNSSAIAKDANQSCALARKRRRLLMRSQRASSSFHNNSQSSSSTSSNTNEVQKSSPDITPSSLPQEQVSSCCDTSSSLSVLKKAQKRYDPDVPMSKEETAAWRREQRRKRNRESAAASRQRQRDRIQELEGEVQEWKYKFEDVMKRLQSLENILASSDPSTQDPLSLLGNAAFTISPPSSQSSSPK